MTTRVLPSRIVCALLLLAAPASATTLGLQVGASLPFGRFAEHPSAGAGIPDGTVLFGPGARLGLTLRLESAASLGWRFDVAGSLHATGDYERVAREAGLSTSAWARGLVLGVGHDWGGALGGGRWMWGASVLAWFPSAGERYAGTSVEYFRTYRNGPGLGLRAGWDTPVGDRLDLGFETGVDFALPGLLAVGASGAPVTVIQLSLVARFHPGGRR